MNILAHASQVIDTLKMGGYTMVPLLAASVLLVAIVLERLIILRRERILPQNLVRLVDQANKPDVLQAIRTEAYRSDAPLARVLRVALDHANDTRANAIEAVTAAGKEQAHHLERGLGVIDTIAVACPPLGLLGTLFGLMDVFMSIQQQGQTTLGAAGPGIAKALITTIVGLIIAIPALLSYNLLSRRVDGLVLALEKHISLFIIRTRSGKESLQENAEWSFTEARATGQ